ncbi:hypothetical protein PchlO6_2097 [Pseudomonas chlororaphis O6]|uniref:Phage protein n=1 Tax=Pseudomonas chlororaphis O6 TaxID=1037915 RepID=A0AB33WMB0_9PSED|nr:hypothetical protein PchlO6_2097 [Pseudomonas chlororaphis O6]
MLDHVESVLDAVPEGPLYAAPVAVVLPPRKPAHAIAPDNDMRARLECKYKGYNEALDDVARLNAGPVADEDWHMNPCKQGHLDVGAGGGVASCYQCDEKITAATTQEAFKLWNAAHPKP